MNKIITSIGLLFIALYPLAIQGQVTDTGNNVGIGNATPAHKLDVNGDINLASGSKLLINSRPVVSTVGVGNTFIGDLSGAAISTGTNNAFIGYKSGIVNTTGHSNAFIGFKAGENNISGFSNAFIGQQAGAANTSGKTNVMIGRRAGFASAAGDDNVFVGHLAGQSNNGGSSNTYLGSGADGSPALTNASAIGANANVTQSNSIVLGSGANVGIGTSAPAYDLHVVGDMNFTGTLYQNGVPFSSGGATGTTGPAGAVGPTGPAGIAVTGITGQTLRNDFGSWVANSTIYNDGNWVGIGTTSPTAQLDVNGDAHINSVKVGRGGGDNISNTTVGANALVNNASGLYNTSIGSSAMLLNTTGSSNTAIGNGAMISAGTGDNNTTVGANGLSNTSSGSDNTSVGQGALTSTSSGNENTAVGRNAGAFNSTGSGNVFIGNRAGYSETGSNKLYIENSSADANNALIYGDFNTDLLRVNGTLNVNNAFSFPISDGTSGQVLQTDGSGNVTWGSSGGSVWNQSGAHINYTAGNVGIGTVGSSNRLKVDGDNSSNNTVMDVDVTYSGTSNVIALSANSSPGNGYGYGIHSVGGNIGVFGSNPGGTWLGNSYGVKGSATGTGGNRYAVHGEASNPGGNFAVGCYGWGGNATTSYGIWGSATGGTTNWAGYFAQGNVYIQNNLGIGTTSPSYDLDVSGDINFTGDLYQNGVLFSGGGGGGSLWTQSGSDIYYSSGNLGVGTTPTYSRMRVLGSTLVPHPVIDIDAAYTGNTSVDGINVTSVPADGYGRGVNSTGGEVGVYAYNPGAAFSGASQGVYGYSTGTAGDRYGVYGSATNSGGTSATGLYGSSSGTAATNYGVYGSAGGGTTNWAGYFKNGNVYVENNTGIGTETPAAKLDVQGFPTSNSTIVHAEVNASSATDIRAVYGISNPTDGYGIGVEGTGGYRGVYAVNPGGSYSGQSFGLYGYSSGSAGSRYGVYGNAYNTGTNAIGVYGSASGATNNWAGYFEGNTHVSGQLRVGTTTEMPGYQVNVDGGVICSEIRAENGNGWAGYLVGDTYVSNNLMIGTTTAATGFALSVDGGIMCEEIKVQDSGSWPDYVFAKDYDLPTLDEVENCINENSHLPGVPDACTVEEEGINLGEMQKLMMEKIEEGMLYTIQLKKEIEELKVKNAELEARLGNQ